MLEKLTRVYARVFLQDPIRDFDATVAKINRPYPYIVSILEAAGVKGRRSNADNCPIHNFIVSRLSPHKGITVRVSRVAIALEFYNREIRSHFIVDNDLGDFIQRFDEGHHSHFLAWDSGGSLRNAA